MQNLKVSSFFLTRQTGEAQEELDGSITPVASISSKISSSASLAAIGGRRGDCLMGRASPVSMSCSISEQKPKSAEDDANVSFVVSEQKFQTIKSFTWKSSIFHRLKKKNVHMFRQIKISSGGCAWFYDLTSLYPTQIRAVPREKRTNQWYSFISCRCV